MNPQFDAAKRSFRKVAIMSDEKAQPALREIATGLYSLTDALQRAAEDVEELKTQLAHLRKGRNG